MSVQRIAASPRAALRYAPRAMRHAVLILLCAFLATGCKSQCRVLSEKRCDCTLTTSDKTSCLTDVATREANNPPTDEDEEVCKGLIEQCDCRLLDTPEGKEKCGVSNKDPQQ